MPAIAGSWIRKRHLAIEFVIWKRECAWFWFLMHPLSKGGGIIAATTNEACATREACKSIEAMLAIS
jgi:hypothetical protein